MIKIILVLCCLLLTACFNNAIEPATDFETVDAKNTTASESETETEPSDITTETRIYPIIIRYGNKQCGYVVGGLVNGKMIDFQENGYLYNRI